jgi:hypothetical protein
MQAIVVKRREGGPVPPGAERRTGEWGPPGAERKTGEWGPPGAERKTRDMHVGLQFFNTGETIIPFSP